MEAEALQSPGCLMTVSFAPGPEREADGLPGRWRWPPEDRGVRDTWLAKAAQEWSECLLKADDSGYIGNSYTAALLVRRRSKLEFS